MEQKADAMVKRLTLRQKLEFIGGQNGMFIRAEPSIGFPQLKMSDGPMGVRTWGPDTAYAAGIGLAASWDTALAHEVGVGLGEDARARGVNFLLGPGIDIYRSPRNGRNFEYFGEDPYLTGQIAANYILGVQSQGVSATVKHYALNNSEFDRHNENSIANERTMREIYLPGFEAAVKQGHVGAVMDSYNLINGEHATQNKFLNIDVLRKDWGFRGILMSDWDATYDAVAAANNGLDLEMPSGKWMNAKNLMPAIRDGRVQEATIDQKVRRIIRTALQFNFLARPQLDLNVPSYNQRGAEIALKTAEEGAVLLKNEGNLLPLDRKKIHSIAMLGPDAYPAVPTAGGSANVTAFAPVSFMTGMSNAVYPGAKVYWNAGVEASAKIYSDSQWCQDAECKMPGLRWIEYDAASNTKIDSGVDQTLDEDSTPTWKTDSEKSVRFEWDGYMVPKTTGEYDFLAQVGPSYGSGAKYQLTVNGKQILSVTQGEGGTEHYASTVLEAGKPAKVQFVLSATSSRKMPLLGVIAESELVDSQAIRLAKMADVVVLNVGFSPATEAEGRDRTYYLPIGQEQLIQEVAAANPHTIVVLTAGGSVATADWLDKVPALVQTWYAGQEAGVALPKLLFGEVNPSGKLPISWARKIEDNPTTANYYEKPGTVDVKYAEGIFIGYRYFETSKVKPLFPFGFGLSYTRFAFSNLKVSPAKASPDGPITVQFDVKNIGSRAGAEVAQVYVGDPSATAPRPKMELKGFSRVMLEPGEVRHVTATLNNRSLAYWDVNTHGWKVDPGKFIVYVGDSSENVPLQKSFTVQ
jgi:beta-glucosidase